MILRSLHSPWLIILNRFSITFVLSLHASANNQKDNLLSNVFGIHSINAFERALWPCYIAGSRVRARNSARKLATCGNNGCHGRIVSLSLGRMGFWISPTATIDSLKTRRRRWWRWRWRRLIAEKISYKCFNGPHDENIASFIPDLALPLESTKYFAEANRTTRDWYQTAIQGYTTSRQPVLPNHLSTWALLEDGF